MVRTFLKRLFVINYEPHEMQFVEPHVHAVNALCGLIDICASRRDYIFRF